MATLDGGVVSGGVEALAQGTEGRWVTLAGGLTSLATGVAGQITVYLMRWFDPDCGSPTYRTWQVSDAPDPTGLQYSGPKCGGTAISGAVVAASWVI